MNKKYEKAQIKRESEPSATPVLDSIKSVADIRALSINELTTLSDEVREFIVDSVSKTGGHLSSSLGVVEMTVALHHVFNTPKDKLIWDVGHQSYAHKILTGRKNVFHTLRTFGGISGFPKTSESAFDTYNVGHSSTSLSLALGEAVSRDLKNENHKVVAVIGDGSLSSGVALEAINQMGHTKHDLIIVLNDNKQSISKNVGALSTYLTKLITNPHYNKFRRSSQRFVQRIPKLGGYLFDFIYKFIRSGKNFIMPNNFFQDLGVRYFGPVNGHDVGALCDIFNKVKHINQGPKIIHVITQKGRGYTPSENAPSAFHGVGPFEKSTGKSLENKAGEYYSNIAGKTLAHLSASNKKLVAITAAMKHGTGLVEFEKKAPDRFFDVGIAEQHAITFSSALAKGGLRPFVAIYSTFLQRACDQLIHDVGIMNLPVRVLIDRAGIVGADGETHHGVFDIAMIKNIPNFMFLAPSSGEELRDMIHFAATYDKGPIAIRYPRGKTLSEKFDFGKAAPFIPGKIKRLTKGNDLAILALGDMVSFAMEVRAILKNNNIETSVINLLSIKPIDVKGIEGVLEKSKYFITLENGILSGGIGEHILSIINHSLCEKHLFTGAFPDEFIPHGSNVELFKQYGLDPASLSERVLKSIKQK